MPYATRPAPRFGVCRCIRIKCWRRSSSSEREEDRKSTRLNSSHSQISYAVFCLKKKNTQPDNARDQTFQCQQSDDSKHDQCIQIVLTNSDDGELRRLVGVLLHASQLHTSCDVDT